MGPAVSAAGRLAALTLVMVALGPVSPDGYSPTAELPAGHGRTPVPAHREEQAPAGASVRPAREVDPANPFILPSTATTVPGFEMPGDATSASPATVR